MASRALDLVRRAPGMGLPGGVGPGSCRLLGICRELQGGKGDAKNSRRTACHESIRFSSEHCPFLLVQEPAPKVTVGGALGLNLHVQPAAPKVRDLFARQLDRAADRAL